MAELLIVENRASRRGKRVAAALRRQLEERSSAASVEWATISRLGDAGTPERRVLAVGGDGTVNAVASWLEERRQRLPLGIVPAGTGNNLARGLGIPLDTDLACRVALESEETAPLDALAYTDGAAGAARLMIQAGALGFPADVALRYDRLRRNPAFRFVAAATGTYIYLALALTGVARQRWRERRGLPHLNIRCEIDGETLDEDILALFIGNEKSLGGGFLPCPRARVDDGKIDLCVVRAGSGRSYLRLLARVSRGEHVDLDDCIVYRQTAQPVEMRLSRPAPFLADGDLWLHDDRYRLEVLPGRFDIVVDGGRQPGSGEGSGE